MRGMRSVLPGFGLTLVRYKVETEIGKAYDWLSRVQEMVDNLERYCWV